MKTLKLSAPFNASAPYSLYQTGNTHTPQTRIFYLHGTLQNAQTITPFLPKILRNIPQTEIISINAGLYKKGSSPPLYTWYTGKKHFDQMDTTPIVEIINAYQTDYKPVAHTVLFGFSAGGLVAQKILTEHNCKLDGLLIHSAPIIIERHTLPSQQSTLEGTKTFIRQIIGSTDPYHLNANRIADLPKLLDHHTDDYDINMEIIPNTGHEMTTHTADIAAQQINAALAIR